MTTPAPTAPTSSHVTICCQFCEQWNRVDASRVSDRPKCGSCARPFLLDRPWPLNAETYHRTIAESALPVLIDFYADWCGPCKAMAPAVDALASKYQGKILVGKLDTDRAQDISNSLGIRGIPTVIVFKQGAETSRRSGAMPLSDLEKLL